MAASAIQVNGQNWRLRSRFLWAVRRKIEEVEMMFSGQFRRPITHRLVSLSCWSCRLQTNTKNATLKPKYSTLSKYPRIQLVFNRRWCNGESAQPKRCWLSWHNSEQRDEQNATANHAIGFVRQGFCFKWAELHSLSLQGSANQPLPPRATKWKLRSWWEWEITLISDSTIYDSRPVRNMWTFASANSNHIHFLIAVVLTWAKINLRSKLYKNEEEKKYVMYIKASRDVFGLYEWVA